MRPSAERVRAWPVHRYLNANGLTGLVPTQLCSLINASKTLEYCYLEDNPFQCPLPGCAKGAAGHGGCGATCKSVSGAGR